MIKKNLYGFTLIESIIVVSIIALLTGLTTVNLFGIQDKTSLAVTVDTLISDIKQQQIKAMIGDTEGRASQDNYGIYFTPVSYVLFHGSSYSPTDFSNVIINLNDNVGLINIALPNSVVIFSKISGEVADFITGSDTITIKHNLSGEQKTIKINLYGAITDIN